MIHALDHIALGVVSAEAAMQSYATLLGRKAENTTSETASIQLANVCLDFVALPSAEDAEGLAGLAFSVGDLAKTRHLLERRAMRVHMADGRLHVATDSTHGVALSLIERESQVAAPSPLAADADASVSALDHVVIRTPNPERAIALYAGRLELSLRLDRSEPSSGVRLLFFRCGNLIIEVAHDIKAGVSNGRDTLWGLSWRVPDTTHAHGRIRAAGIDVSEIRSGRRPGTRVFTVRSHTAGVPTIMIGPDKSAAA